MSVGMPTLPSSLVAIQSQLEDRARQYGLDFFSTIFELVDVDQLNAVAARGGFPTRYPHWRFGMEYQQLARGYRYGLQKIYELVINNDPCYAYLLNSNSMTDHMMVIAHVYGHGDFFKHNAWFSQTNRKMMDVMANHGQRIARYIDRFGVEEVEAFIDACLSLENLIDIHSPFIRRVEAESRPQSATADEGFDHAPAATRFQSKPYLDRYVNPPAAIAREQHELARQHAEPIRVPREPTRDVLLFLLQHAPLKTWQADVLSMIRDEAYYFAPQAQTKIMNEGWATYWHSTIMTQHGLMHQGDVISYADHTSGTLASAPMRLNPYKLGLELFRDIEDRWNRGCFGREYDACDHLSDRRRWDSGAGQGREKIFEVRRIHNDLTFIDEFLTLDFCQRTKMFSFGYREASGQYAIESRKFEVIKQQLLFSLTNLGRPLIDVVDGNHKNRGELYLRHQFNGPELKVQDAQDTLVRLHQLWQRPVSIESALEGCVCVLSFDGSEHHIDKTGRPVASADSA